MKFLRHCRLLLLLTPLSFSWLVADSTPPPEADERDRFLAQATQDPAIVQLGRETYGSLCQACHGDSSAQAEAASNLFDGKWHHGSRPKEIEQTIRRGVDEKGMPGWGEVLSGDDITALTIYLLSAQKPPR